MFCLYFEAQRLDDRPNWMIGPPVFSGGGKKIVTLKITPEKWRFCLFAGGGGC